MDFMDLVEITHISVAHAHHHQVYTLIFVSKHLNPTVRCNLDLFKVFLGIQLDNKRNKKKLKHYEIRYQ